MSIKKYLVSTLIGVAVLVGCKKDTYEKIDSVCPKVMFTDPAAGATGVPTNQIVTVTFNEEMDPASFTNLTFIVSGSVVPGTVSYNGLSATFTPSDPLMTNHTYMGRVTTGVKDKMGNRLQQEYVWTFSTGNILSPMVIATNPINQQLDVPHNQLITALFSEQMNRASLTDSSFTLKQGTNLILGTVTYSDSVAYFTPAIPLASNTNYTATITTKARSNQGSPLENDYVWSFTTMSVLPPTIVLTNPLDNAKDVELNKIITANFSDLMDFSTINSSSFTIMQGSNIVTGALSYSGTTAFFKPSANFLINSIYVVKISNAVKNQYGFNMVSDFTWTFTTGTVTAPIVISTDPINLASGIAIDKTISAIFSEVMDPLTINSTTFTVKNGNSSVTGAVTYSGLTATFNPSIDLLPGTKYTATISTGAKSIGGIAKANAHIWTFTTLGNTINPTVISTDPLNLASEVELNKKITVAFSTNMDASSITGSSFTLKQGSVTIPGMISYAGKTAFFTPSSNLESSTTYTATITTDAKDLLGTPLLNDYVWKFETGSTSAPKVISTEPLNLATDVDLSTTIAANFSEQMNAQSISTSTFTIKEGNNTINGTVWYSGKTAFFKPNTNLISGLTYKAMITKGAQNTNGVNMANDHIWTFSTKAPLGPKSPTLKGVSRFGIIAGVGVSNNAGFSVINNLDVGIYPGTRSSISGFPPAKVVNGAIYASDDVSPSGVAAMLLQAKTDLTAAYLFAEAATSPAPASVSGDLGGKTLAPGIYKTTSTLLIQKGDLTLDAKGDPNAVWIFQIAAAFTTVGGAGGNIILSGGAQAKNVYWQVGSSATIGSYTSFKGNILALSSITMGEYATAVGRMLARNASVVMTSTNTIDKP